MSEPLPSRVVKVTLYEDRAEVKRSVQVSLPAGSSWVAVAGATPFLDDRSVLAAVRAGPASVLGTRVRRRVDHAQTHGHDEVRQREEAVEAAHVAHHAAQVQLDLAMAGAERGRAMAARWAEGVALRSRGIHERVEAWREAYREAAQAEAQALAAAAEARRQVATAADDLAGAQARLRDALRTYLRHEAVLLVQVDVEGSPDTSSDVTLEVTYRVPGALWRPEHAVFAWRKAGGKVALELVTWAAIWQRTGEAWQDVEIELSTARPGRAARPPLVTDDLVVSRRKTEAEQKHTLVEARDQIIEKAGASGATRVDHMPGVDDGGVPRVYQARGDLPSDGRPVRVEIERTRLEAALDVVAFPELSGSVYFRARGVLARDTPLLAGPLHVTLDGVVAGRQEAKLVGAGEPFEIGLGTEDALRVRRHTEGSDDTSFTGAQRRKRSVTVWVTNLGLEPRRATVVERVPVSEIERLEVQLTGGKAWRFDPRDGFAEREVEVLPQQTVELGLSYEVQAPAKMLLPNF